MRARNIKPGFFKNADLAECSLGARLLAPGLWMLADREGRLEDRPKQIKGEIFPYDSFDVDALLSELETWHHIERYEVEGKRYIQILKFRTHQTPHIKEKQSTIPKSPRLAPDLPDLGEGENPLNPDILIPDCSSTEEDVRERLFREEVWPIFPKQRAGSSDKGLTAYRAARRRGATHEEIMRGLRAYATSEEVRIGRAKGCAAWFNDDRWTVDYTGNGAKPLDTGPTLTPLEQYHNAKHKLKHMNLDPEWTARFQKIVTDFEAQNANRT